MPHIALIVVTILLAGFQLRAADIAPLTNAHAHNDFLHKNPLQDALAHHFTSVEADIFLIETADGSKLPVAHFQFMIDPERTLQSLYLTPLRARIKAHGGSVFGDGKPFHLLIDIKTDAEPTYRALAKVLADYDDIITSVGDCPDFAKPAQQNGTQQNGVPQTEKQKTAKQQNGTVPGPSPGGQMKIHQKAVNVTISGNRPIEQMKKEPLRYAGIDGRWGDLDSDLPSHLMPLISDNWSNHFTWTGDGPMPAAEKERLADAVKRAHAHGRKLRLWATPDKPAIWQALDAAGVDFINTDDLAGLEKFLREQRTSK